MKITNGFVWTELSAGDEREFQRRRFMKRPQSHVGGPVVVWFHGGKVGARLFASLRVTDKARFLPHWHLAGDVVSFLFP